MTAAVTTSQRVVISSDAKASLQAYFDEEEWLLNTALFEVPVCTSMHYLGLVVIKSDYRNYESVTSMFCR
jgi:hypothetical protein